MVCVPFKTASPLILCVMAWILSSGARGPPTESTANDAHVDSNGRGCENHQTWRRYLNAYHNGSTAPSPDTPADLASFMLAADPVLLQAAELARVLARAYQEAATQLIGRGELVEIVDAAPFDTSRRRPGPFFGPAHRNPVRFG